MRVSPGMLTFLAGLVILAVAGLFYQQQLAVSGLAGGTGAAPATAAANVKYMCPMRCVELDEPGDCPVCGMETVAVELASASSAPAAELYSCPLHPHVEQDHAGTCPSCGMELVPKVDDAASVPAATRELVSAVKLSPLQSVLANVEAVQPHYEAITLQVRAIGEVQVPEDNVNELVSWQSGRIDNLVLRDTGGIVSKGDHLLDIYSEELVQAQEEYLLAFDAVDRLGDSAYPSVADSAKQLLDAARRKLLRLGYTAQQLAELAEARTVSDLVPVHATHGGTVMDKYVSEGMYIREGQQLFTVADLGTVWVEVEVFESDMQKLGTGMAVTLLCPVHPGMVFRGTIDLIEPSLSPGTRTHRVRVSVRNLDGILRPGMVLEAELNVDHGKRLVLPRNAVLHTGDGDLVYVLAGENRWEPRLVTVGNDFGDLVEITTGLGDDEAVAATAVFLIDSEAQLKGVPRPGIDAPASASDGGGHVH